MARKIFKYRGYTLEELQDMSLEEFIELLPARQRRSLKRGFLPRQQAVLDKMRKLYKEEKKGGKPVVVRTHCRDMVVIPEMVGKTFGIYNGKEFVEVFNEEAKKMKDAEYLAQGTLYTDVIESGTDTAQTIKSHHNVGGLPKKLGFKLIEPLRSLFKDETRELGEKLGIPHDLVWRQPFPGPGLGIRVLGEITPEKLEIVRESDAILREEIKKAGLDEEIWQYFTVLPGIRSVGVMGDGRTYDYAVGIRAVTSIDGMTADFAKIPWDVLQKISVRIVNEVDHVNRILYDVTSKPPSTIEWE